MVSVRRPHVAGIKWKVDKREGQSSLLEGVIVYLLSVVQLHMSYG